jgi:hypothetical protein
MADDDPIWMPSYRTFETEREQTHVPGDLVQHRAIRSGRIDRKWPEVLTPDNRMISEFKRGVDRVRNEPQLQPASDDAQKIPPHDDYDRVIPSVNPVERKLRVHGLYDAILWR